MDVSNREVEEPGGLELIKTLVTLTGLPSARLERELEEILQKNGRSVPGELTLDDVRLALAAHLEELMGGADQETADLLTPDSEAGALSRS